MIEPIGTEGFALSSGTDPDRLRRAFAESGAIQIHPFLAGDGADRLRAHLAGRNDWTRVIKTAAGGTYAQNLAKAGFSAAQLKALEMLAAPGAGLDFTYVYDRIAAVDGVDQRCETGTLLASFADFLESAPMLALLASISGARDVTSVETQATRYCPGHFLTTHYDLGSGGRRRVAYVFGLTETWRAEWGGLLLFHDKAGEVERGFIPKMNALTLFSVPRAHSVSLVSPLAGAQRYSITGWLNGPLEGDAVAAGRA